MNDKKYMNEAAAQVIALKDSVWQLGNTLRDLKSRLETIEETNPELYVSEDIKQAHYTLEKYAPGCLRYAPHPFGLKYDRAPQVMQAEGVSEQDIAETMPPAHGNPDQPFNMTDEIQHQTQPTGTSCAHTCVAMVIGVPVQEILDKYGEGEEGLSFPTQDRIIRDYGFESNTFEGNNLPPTGTFIVTVPSLNIEGGLHAIVIQMENDRWRIYDPNTGREGAKTYTTKNIKTWVRPTMVWKRFM